MLRNHYADLLFFSAQGISKSGEVSESSLVHCSLQRVMISRAKTKIFLADHTKLGKQFAHRICDKSELDHIVCDIDVSKEFDWFYLLRLLYHDINMIYTNVNHWFYIMIKNQTLNSNQSISIKINQNEKWIKNEKMKNMWTACYISYFVV